MTSIERTAYPRFKRYFTPKELAEIYTPTQSEIAFAYATTQGTSHIFNLIVLLKSFQRLGYFPKLSDIPNPLINHIRGCLKLPPEIVLGYEKSKTMYRHRSAIREYLKVKDFDKMARHTCVGTVYESALVMDNPADLINVAIGELVKQRYELPGFPTLDRLVRRVRYLVNQKIFNWVINGLDEEYIQRLNDLLDSHLTESRTPFNNLKQLPKRPTRNHLNDLLVHLTWLETLGDVKPFLSNITAAKIQHFAAEAKALSASEMKAITLPKRLTLLTAATNKVEAYHGFSKWFFFGGEGIIGYNAPEEQEKVIKYNDLIANAVIFHNVVDLTNVLRDLKLMGYLIDREDVAVLSPYMTSHIKRFGDYLIDLDELPHTLDEVTAFVLA